MKVNAITVQASRSLPDAASLFYNIIGRGCEVLPPIERILRAVAQPTQYFAWLAKQPTSPVWSMRCFYLEPLTEEPTDANEFLIRLEKTATDGNKSPMRILLRGTEQALLSVRLEFSQRGNQRFASVCLYDLQEALTEQRIQWDSLDLLVEGSITDAKSMRETQLAAFHLDRDGRFMEHRGGR